MKGRMVLISLITIQITVFLFAHISVAAEPAWVPGTPMLSPRTGPGVTLGKDGLIYAIGGVDYWYGPSHATNTAERFNEATDRWEYIASMAQKRHTPGAITDSVGRIWVVGGMGPRDDIVYDTVERYNPASNSWTTLSSKLKTKRTTHGIAITKDDVIYVFGGWSEYSASGWLKSTEKYDPHDNDREWKYVASMKQARSHPGIAMDEQSRVYACGGEKWGGSLSTVERYDPALDKWEDVNSLPEPMGNPAAFTLNGEIYVVGGWQSSRYAYTNACYIYSPSTNTWRAGPRMYEEVGLARAVVGLSGKVYLIGGEEQGGQWARDKVAVLNPSSGWSFAIITDPHIGKRQGNIGLVPVVPWYDYDGTGWDDNLAGEEHLATMNLTTAVQVINNNTAKYNIKFVVVGGDLTDSGELSELNKVKGILNGLDIPWIPLVGNHDVWPAAAGGCALIEGNIDPDMHFDTALNGQYEEFPSELGVEDSWRRWGRLTWNSNLERYNYFQNFAFDYKGYHFVGLDFNYRGQPPKWFPAIPYTLPRGDLHDDLDNDEGTWDWFRGHVENYVSGHPDKRENIILFAHHPFRNFQQFDFGLVKWNDMGFSDGELSKMRGSLEDYRGQLWCEFAGHSHENLENLFQKSPGSEIMQIVETDETHSAPLVRIVQFYPEGTKTYSKILPENAGYIKVIGPVDLEITDPDGLTISKEINEIPGAWYFEESIDDVISLCDFVYISEMKPGDYQAKVILRITAQFQDSGSIDNLKSQNDQTKRLAESDANSTNTFTLELAMCEDSFGYAPIVLAEEVPVQQIPTEPYQFKVQKREPARVNYTGNLIGEYRGMVGLSATVTDSAHRPLKDKTIVFELGTWSTSITTDSNGLASTSLTLEQAPGEYYYVEAGFSGDQDYLPARDSESFVIAPPSVDRYVHIDVRGAGYDHKTNLFSIDVTVTNTSSRTIGIPLWLVIESVSEPNVALSNSDGATPDGKGYIGLSDLVLDDGQLDPNESITKRISFNDPKGVRFTFEPSVRGVILEPVEGTGLGNLSRMSQNWLKDEPTLDIAPLGGDGIINLRDFAVLAERWLEGR